MMRLEFTLRQLPGFVDVTLVPNVEPEALGCRASGFGFPVCTATVSFEGQGYAAALGWIQLVRSTDGPGPGVQFEMDPYEPLGTLPHPFCWFGFAPMLFDAPSRARRDDLDWTANSFLAFIGEPHEVRAILGFSWGFVVREQVVVIEDAAPLAADTWAAHLPLLRHAHPSWRFASGYHNR
jgi:hypothetical protein